MLKIIAMKWQCWVSTILTLFVAYALQCGTASAYRNLMKLADGVYCYVNVINSGPQNSYGANAGVVIGSDGIAVIDTLISSKLAKKFIREIRSQAGGKPVKYVINTHYHIDHTFGNSEFAKIGATIISHVNTKENLEKNAAGALKNFGAFGLSKEQIEGTTIAYPDITFEKRMEIDLGDEKIILIYPGPSHTSGSILVYLPKEKILFAGDILVANYHPFMGDGNINEWIEAIDKIAVIDAGTIIPGHGPLSSKQDALNMKKYLMIFDEQSQYLASKYENVEDILLKLKKSLPDRKEGGIFIKPNLEIKYLKTTNQINLN